MLRAWLRTWFRLPVGALVRGPLEGPSGTPGPGQPTNANRPPWQWQAGGSRPRQTAPGVRWAGPWESPSRVQYSPDATPTSRHRGWRIFCTGARPGYRFAGQSRRGSRQAWAPAAPAARPQQRRLQHGSHASTVVMAVIVAISAFLIGLWAPGRDGRQLRLVRRILAGWRIAGQPMPSTAPAELRALPQQKDCCTFQAKPPRYTRR
jgi:hypothetical protein